MYISKGKLTPSGRIVRGEGNIPCTSCGKMFSTVSNMGRHQREHCPGRMQWTDDMEDGRSSSFT